MIEYPVKKSTYKKWSELYPWDLLISGTRQTLSVEDRCSKPINQIMSCLKDSTLHLGISRGGEKHRTYKLECDNGEQSTTSAQKFSQSLLDVIKNNDCGLENILLDITSLELDVILHLIHFFHHHNTKQLYIIYTSPKVYGNKEDAMLRLKNIEQPPGYICLRFESGTKKNYPHIVILGFDENRATRIFDEYLEWQDEYKYAIIGSPAYVEDGEIKATNANLWTKNIPTENTIKVDGLKPNLVKKELEKLFTKYGHIDILPMGPKPMLLGVILFYFSLSECDSNNVRILYDFPTPTKNCTTGIKSHYLFNYNELAS